MGSFGVIDGENPYPALSAHRKLGKHEKTYVVDGVLICHDCGEILGPIGVEQNASS